MTDDEWRTFLEALYAAFPGLRAWVVENSPNEKLTHAAWRKTLDGYSYDECSEVLDEWLTGRLKPFEAYERDKIALVIRSRIGFKRGKQAEAEAVAARARIMAKRDKYVRPNVLVQMDKYYQRALEYVNLWKNGLMSEQEMHAMCDQIKDQHWQDMQNENKKPITWNANQEVNA